MSSIDGERSWRDLTNRLDDKAKDDFFRLNIPFTGDEPRLDDVQCVDGLRQSVRLQPQGAKDRTDVTFALLVASFYFELDAIPVFEANRYYCTGVIRCRNDAHGVLQLLGRLHDGLEFATDAESLGELTIKDVCPRCHIYCKKVNFSVRYLDDVISMKLKIPDRLQRKISGFPHSMTWFIAQQHLDASFGEPAHDSSLRDRCDACEVFDATRSRLEKPEAVRPPSTEPRLCTSRIRQKRKIDDLSGTGCSHKYKRLRLKTSS